MGSCPYPVTIKYYYPDLKGGRISMSKQVYYYAGVGLVFGAAIGGIAAVIFYGLTANNKLFAFAGAGAALGLLIGGVIDMYRSKNDKK